LSLYSYHPTRRFSWMVCLAKRLIMQEAFDKVTRYPRTYSS
jgi:hypothetical protein